MVTVLPQLRLSPTTENNIYAQFAPNPVEDFSEFLQRIRLDWKTVHDSMLLQQERMKQRTDQSRRKSEIAVGGEVLVSVKKFDRPDFAAQGKLMPYYSGPFRVIEKS